MFFIGIFQKGFNPITAFYVIHFYFQIAVGPADAAGVMHVILSQNLTIFVILGPE